jgi:membrane-bound lytic murein transglycosylase B
MLRLKRLAVLGILAFCVITGLAFWALHWPGAYGVQPPPPQSTAQFALATGSTHAVNISKSTINARWLAKTAAQTGIPARALHAYAAAAAMANATAPTCRIGWNTVAAIGFIETAHGTHGGGRLTAAGHPSRPIIGPSLNGDGFAAIADTDAGALDGDALWDRAVGPMQFIPATWQEAGRDANGDGAADPHNIDDAALSAASYLCAGSRDLTTAGGWADAVYSYNQSDAYVGEVRAQAAAYAGAAVG